MRKLLRRRYSVTSWVPIGIAALTALTMAASRGASELRAAMQEPPTPLYLVNAGDCGATDWSGMTWEADQSFDEEWGFVGDREAGSWDLDVDDIYRCASLGQSFGYQFALSDGEYRVELHFLEPELEPGERQFDVKIEGEKVLEGFDIAAESGGTAIDIERSFVANVEDGRLEIDFAGDEPGALVSAIAIEGVSLVEPPDSSSDETVDEQPTATPTPVEQVGEEPPADPGDTGEPVADETVEPTVEPTEEPPGDTGDEDTGGDTGGAASDDQVVDDQPADTGEPVNEPVDEPVDDSPVPYRQYVNVGQCDAVEWDGVTWAADQAYSPGSWGNVPGEGYVSREESYTRVSDSSGNPYGENGQYLHRCRAYGKSFGYYFDLPNGEYTIRLRFAEPVREPGQRQFDVLVEGQMALDDFDIAAQAGGIGIATEVRILAAVSDGQLNVDFVGGQGESSDPNALVQAIGVIAGSDAAATPTPDPGSVMPAGDGQDPPATEEPTEVPGAAGGDGDTQTPPADGWYVNAGACSEVRWMGQVWLADQPYAAGGWGHVGSDYYAVSDDVADPVSDENRALYGADGQYLHRCQVYGQDFGYQFDLPNGSYQVRLRFAEPLYEAGERWFDVAAEGVVVLDDFDVSQEAGGQDIAVERAFTATVADGQLRVDFVGGQDGSSDPNALLQAISVVPAGAAYQAPEPVDSDLEEPAFDSSDESSEELTILPPYAQYVNAGRCGAVEWDGEVWEPDQVYSNNSWGRVGSYSTRTGRGRITDSSGARYTGDAQSLHACYVQGQRFGYRFDVPDGTYRVRLRFVEPRYDPGRRWFDVAIEDQLVLDNFDVAAEAGQKRVAIERTFEVDVTDGQLAIDFWGRQRGSYSRQAVVQALGIAALSAAPAEPPTGVAGGYVFATPVPTPTTPPPPTPTPVPGGDPPVADAYYVAPNGSDGNPGTRDRPWRTIQHAAETAQAGDTVYIRAGTYSEAVQFRHSGREGSPITFQSYPGEEVTIQGGEWFGLGLLDVDWVVVDGLRVFGAGSHGILLSNANHNVIRNCESGNNGWDGVMITAKNGEGDSSYNTISGCTIHDNTHEGVYVQSGWQQERVIGNVIEYNLITGSGDEAVQNNRWDQSTYDPPFPTGTIIRGNVIHDNHGEWGMMQLYGDDLLVEDNLLYDNSGTDYTSGIAYGRGDGAVIRNNVLVNNDGQASYDAAIFVGEASNLTVVHNTIVGHGGFGIFLKLISGEALVANNLVYGTESVPIQLDEGTEDVRPTHNLIDADPLFVNPDEMDFHLRAGSPAIDAGLDVGVGADADGKPRPQGDGVDIGAYEFGG